MLSITENFLREREREHNILVHAVVRKVCVDVTYVEVQLNARCSGLLPCKTLPSSDTLGRE
jgi:hypothetical protein